MFNLFIAFALSLVMMSFHSAAQTVTIHQKDLTLERAIQQIQHQTGYDFLFDSDLIKGKTIPLVQIQNMSIQAALRQLLADTDIDFQLVQKNIILKKKASSITGGTQVNPVKGVVQNTTGTNMGGATVRNQRSGALVVTNEKGEFVIQAQTGDVLEISYLGYQKNEIKVTGNKSIKATLQLALNSMEDVVLVGYGTQKRKFLTGAVSTIDGTDLEKAPAVNVSNTLMGRVTGLSSNTLSGAPDRDRATIKIRDMGEALIVIDGVAREGQGLIGMELDKLDPATIESITVLKDAQAAVYGTRGANGVILVTTKKGIRERPRLTYSGQIGTQRSTRLPRYLDSYNYALLNNEMYDNDILERGSSTKSKFTDEELEKFRDGSDPDRYPNTNWYNEVLNPSAFVQRHNLSVSGGSDRSRYFIGGNFVDQDGLMKTSGFKRYGLVTNTDYDVTKTTNVSVSLNYINETANNPAAYAETVFSRMAALGATMPARFSNGYYAYSGFAGNPLVDVLPESGYNRTSRNVFTGSFGIKQDLSFVKGLSASGLITLDRNNSFLKSFITPQPQYNLSRTTDDFALQNGTEKPYLNEEFNQNTNVNIQLKLNYDRSFGSHQVSAMGLFEQNEFKSDMLSAGRRNFAVSSLDQLFLGDLSTQTNLGNSAENARRSMVGRLVYNYSGRYIVEGSFRLDASPFYPRGNRTGFFPSVSAAWLMSEESFIKDNLDFVDQLKLRGSFGRMGNDGGNLYTYFYNYAVVAAGYVFGTGNTIQPLSRISNFTVPNTNITWEKVDALDIGLNAELWKGKLGFEFDYYNKSKFDILRSRNYDVPLSFGIDAALQNFARERYYGFETALSHRSQLGAFGINARLNLTFTKSKVIDYGENTDVLPGLRLEGSRVGTVRILEADGIFRDEEDVANWAQYVSSPDGTPFSAKPGDVRYRDLNGDGLVELYNGSPDRTFEARYIYPPTIYGLNLGANWKGIQLETFFQAATNTFINYTAANDIANFYELHLDRWTPDNLDASYPRLLSNYPNNALPSTFYVKRGDYLKLRSAQLAYSLPKTWLEQMRISSLTLSIQGQNLFTISKNRRFDPDATGATANLYPPQRIFTFGARIGL